MGQKDDSVVKIFGIYTQDENLDNQILYTCLVDTLVILDTKYRDG